MVRFPPTFMDMSCYGSRTEGKYGVGIGEIGKGGREEASGE